MRLFSRLVCSICAILISLRLFACYFIFGAEANTSARAAVRREMAKKFQLPVSGLMYALKKMLRLERGSGWPHLMNCVLVTDVSTT